MKTMTCNQLGGACDLEFHAETFDDIAQQSRQHGQEMAAQKDQSHLGAMNKMMEMMKEPQALNDWMDQKRQEFASLPKQ